MIRIGVVDDKIMMRQMVSQTLAKTEGCRITLEADNGRDFLEQLSDLPAKERPDMVLMDIDMPVMGGIEAIAIATVTYPEMKFLVLTVFDDDEKIFQAIKAGASGYILKEDMADFLTNAIDNAMHLQGAPMSPAIARKILHLVKEQPYRETAKAEGTKNILDLLSEREKELLALLVEGLNYKAIAERICISPQTVRTHISNIYEKLHVHNKAQAIMLTQKFR